MNAVLESSHSIAKLPKPLDALHGKIRIAPTCAIRASRKRKRHEVAVGVDGEGIDLYNVRGHDLITSYPLPPQTYMSCAPCSVVANGVDDQASKRHTYAIVRDGWDDKRRRLVYFEEPAKPSNVATKPLKQEAKLRNEEVHSLEPYACQSSDGFGIAVIYKDGEIELFSRSVKRQRHLRCSEEESNHSLLFARVIDFESAQKGMLKSREDILSTLAANAEHERLGQGLCRVIRKANKRILQVFPLPVHGCATPSSTSTSLQPLLSYDLPCRGQVGTESDTYDLHAASGQLFQLFNGHLTVFELSELTPKILVELGSAAQPITSATRVTQNIVLAISGEKAIALETVFGTILATAPTQSVADLDITRQRRETSNQYLQTSFISYFPGLDQAVALSGRELVTFPFVESQTGRISKKSRRVLLADVFFNGANNSALDFAEKDRKGREFAAWSDRVDSLVREGDLSSLELFVAEEFKIDLGILEWGQLAADLFDPASINAQNIDQRKALKLLGCMFEPPESPDSEQHSSRIVLRVRAVNLLVWLALAGYLTVPRIQASWSMLNLNSTAVQPGDILIAIRNADSSLQLLHELLSCPAYFDVHDVVQALKILIESLEASPDEHAPMPQRGSPAACSDEDIVKGNSDPIVSQDAALEKASQKAEAELQGALTALTSGLEIRSQSLRLILTRLCRFPSTLVTSVMRNMLTRSEIIFLIHILRIELADGGWTSRYVHVGFDLLDQAKGMPGTLPDDETAESPLDQAVQTISTLLSCAVDAVGVSGWLVGLSGENLGTDDVIECLRAEVSAALEGCYDAANLGLVFGEMEKYTYQQKQAKSAGLGKRKFNGKDSLGHAQVFGHMLPLGCAVDMPIINTTAAKRSKLDIARERNRMVGRYEFDRIRI